jgi:hypothetical protein
MSIAAGLSATKTGFELIKSVREIVKHQGVDPGEVSARLLELQELMLDAKTALAEAQEEKTKLEARIAELMRMADFGAEFTTGEGLYWREEYPYCPSCWDIDRKPVRLGGPVHDIARGEVWQCPIHKVHHITRQRH